MREVVSPGYGDTEYQSHVTVKCPYIKILRDLSPVNFYSSTLNSFYIFICPNPQWVTTVNYDTFKNSKDFPFYIFLPTSLLEFFTGVYSQYLLLLLLFFSSSSWVYTSEFLGFYSLNVPPRQGIVIHKYCLTPPFPDSFFFGNLISLSLQSLI